MAKTIQTRIKLRYDTWANWNTTEGQARVLLAGEMAIVAVPAETTNTGTQITPPAVLFKVGDGTTTFAKLPWGSGYAADVYAWAKKSGITVNTTGSGDFISSLSWSNDQLNITKGSINISVDKSGSNGVVTGITATGSKITYTQTSLAKTDSITADAGQAITGFTLTQAANGQFTISDVTYGATQVTLSSVDSSSPVCDTNKILLNSGFKLSWEAAATKDRAVISVDDSYFNTLAATQATYKIQELDVETAGGSGKYIQSISETDGKISATAADMPTTLPNPNKLVINAYQDSNNKGVITYDGSASVTKNYNAYTGTLTWKQNSTISEFGGAAAQFNIPTPLSSINTSDDTYVNSTAVEQYVSSVISEQTKAYVIDETSEAGANQYFKILNTDAKTTSVSVDSSGRIFTVGEEFVNIAELHVGDVIYTKGAEYKDWFLGDTSTSKYIFYQIASDKPVLDGYVEKKTVSSQEPTLSWGTTSAIGTVDDKIFKVTMPANPDTHYTNTFTIQAGGTAVTSFDQASNKTLNFVAGSNVTLTRGTNAITITAADTHYTTGLYVGATGTKASGATTNGNTYLKLYDDSTSRANINIKGTGSVTVASDSSGNITINGTDSKYTGNLKIQADIGTSATAATDWVNYTPSSSATYKLSHDNYISLSKSGNTVTVGIESAVLTTDDKFIIYGGSATDNWDF